MATEIGARNSTEVEKIGYVNNIIQNSLYSINHIPFPSPVVNVISIRASGSSDYSSTVYSEWNGSILSISSIDIFSNIDWYAEYEPGFSNYWWLSTASGGPGTITSVSITPVGSLPANDCIIHFKGILDNTIYATLTIDDLTS